MKAKQTRYAGLKAIYSILSFLWGSVLTLMVLWTGLFFYSILFAKEYLPIMWGLAANLNLQTLGVATKLTENIWLSTAESSIIVFNPSFGLSLYSYLYMLTIVGAFGYVILITRKIISSVLDGNPFKKVNSVRLRMIGVILIAVPIVLQIVSHIVLNSISIVGTKGINSFSSSYGTYASAGFVFGLLFLVISEVFRVGVLMKEEQDLTV
jgi:hypothetical protein